MGYYCSYLDMDVGGGDGEYVSLDIEAWEDFLESRFKRLSVKIDDPVVREAAPKHDSAAAEYKGKEKEGEGGEGGSASPEGDGTPAGEDEQEGKVVEKEGDDDEVLDITPGLMEGELVESAAGEAGGERDDVGGGDGRGTVVQSSLEEQSVRDEDEGAAQVRDGEVPPENLGGNSEEASGNSSGDEGLAARVQGEDGKVPMDGVLEPGDATEQVREVPVSGGKEELAVSSRSPTEVHPDGGASCEGEVMHEGGAIERKNVSRLPAFILFFLIK